MAFTTNSEGIRQHLETCASLFGGSAGYAAVKNYPNDWIYLILAFDDGEGAYISVKVISGSGKEPITPVDAAYEVLNISTSEDLNLGRMDGHWGVPRKVEGKDALEYVMWAPRWVKAGRKLTRIIQREAKKAIAHQS